MVTEQPLAEGTFWCQKKHLESVNMLSGKTEIVLTENRGR